MVLGRGIGNLRNSQIEHLEIIKKMNNLNPKSLIE